MDLESVFLNGTVGAGKTTTGEALHWLLADDGISNAVIDLGTSKSRTARS